MRPGVLLIRPDQHSDPLELALRDLGYPVYQHAVVTIQPLPIADEVLQHWCEGDWHGVIVISPNAARIFAKQITKFNQANDTGQLSWPRSNYYAVGEGTAETLKPLCQQPITYPASQYTSEVLLALSEFAEVSQQNWLIITGKNGRELLPSTLHKRGATVTVAEIYERQPSVENLPAAEPEWQENVQCIMVSSVEQLQLFYNNLSEQAQQWALQQIWVVPTGRVADKLQELGVVNARIHRAENATPAALTHCFQLIRESQFMSEQKHTEENEQQPNVDTSAASKSTASTKKEAVKQKGSKPTRREPKAGLGWFAKFMFLIIFLCVVVLSVGGYWLWQQQEKIAADTATQLTAVQDRLAQAQTDQPIFQPEQLQQELTNMRESIQREMDNQFARERQARERGLKRVDALREDAIASLQVATDQNSRQLTRLSEQVRTTDVRQSSHWYLLEAFDFVSAAVHRLSFDYNRASAINLLEQARDLLTEQSPTEYQQIIRQINSDLEMIAELPEINTQAIALRLLRMQTQVRALPFAVDFRGMSTPDAAELDTSIKNWRINLASAWESFSEDLIKVQRHDGVPMRLDHDQQALLMSRVELQLQIAQQAALNHHGEYYRNTLRDMIDMLERFFATEHRDVVQMIAELDALQALSVEPDYPTSLLSRAMLRDRIDDIRHNSQGE